MRYTIMAILVFFLCAEALAQTDNATLPDSVSRSNSSVENLWTELIETDDQRGSERAMVYHYLRLNGGYTAVPTEIQDYHGEVGSKDGFDFMLSYDCISKKYLGMGVRANYKSYNCTSEYELQLYYLGCALTFSTNPQYKLSGLFSLSLGPTWYHDYGYISYKKKGSSSNMGLGTQVDVALNYMISRHVGVNSTLAFSRHIFGLHSKEWWEDTDYEFDGFATVSFLVGVTYKF